MSGHAAWDRARRTAKSNTNKWVFMIAELLQRLEKRNKCDLGKLKGYLPHKDQPPPLSFVSLPKALKVLLHMYANPNRTKWFGEGMEKGININNNLTQSKNIILNKQSL